MLHAQDVMEQNGSWFCPLALISVFVKVLLVVQLHKRCIF